MVVGYIKVEKTTKVKDNKFYGNYEIKDTYTHNIVNEKYVGLVPPKNGIHIVLKKNFDGETLDIVVTKYAFTGELENKYCDDTYYSTSFGFSGHIYEVSVDFNGQLICVDEWYSYSDFEDANEPDNHWSKNSKGIKWDLVDI